MRTLELCMFDKPVVNVAYDPPGVGIAPVSCRRYYEFDHYRPVAQSGAVMVANSESEMGALLCGALTDPQAGRAQRRALMTQMFGDTLDGRSDPRMANQFASLVRSRQAGRG